MKSKLKMTVLMIGVGLAGVLLGRSCTQPGTHLRQGSGGQATNQEPGTSSAAEPAIKFWTCSMHPQVKQPGPGKCPLCAMDLIPVMASVDAEPGGLRELTLSPTARALAQVETSMVERRYPTAEIRMVGKVDYDETRLAYLTAWVAGRLDRLYVDYTGIEVKKGDHMVSIYSPELLAAQEELIQSVRAVKEMAQSHNSMIRDRAAQTVNASREKLRLWGLTEEQIRRIEELESPEEHLTIYSPVSGTVIQKNPLEGDYVKTGTRIYTIADLSKVWVKLNAYESDLAWIHYGQQVTFATEAYPGVTFTGTIAFIDPVLNEKTRTVNVRVNVDNREGQLKPGMFVRATVKSNIASGGRIMQPDLAGKMICPMHPEIIQDDPGDCEICGMSLVSTEEFGYLPADVSPEDAPLVIPVTAALITGKRAVVYVESEENDYTYEGREIVLGSRAGDVYIVRRGLREGERVVTRGAFKLDAELQIHAQPSMMTPEGGGAGSAVDSMQAMTLASQTIKDLSNVIEDAGAVETAMGSDDLGEIRFAFSRLLETVDAVNSNLITGHATLLWKEYAMLIGNDGQVGSEVNSVSEAQYVAAQLREHVVSMKEKMGLVHGNEKAGSSEPEVNPVFLTQIQPLVRGYILMQEGLANDDLGGAQEGLEQMIAALNKVDMTLLEGEAHRSWMETSSMVKPTLDRMNSLNDIERIRKEFSGLSDALIKLVKTFGAPGIDLYTAHCPMALEDGADWLQSSEAVRNPYYGASMLECGSVTDAFEAKRLEGAHHHE